MIVVVDYGMGNLHSVAKALEAVGADVVVSAKADDVRKAKGIVLPGVGSFAQGMAHLRELKLVDVLTQEVVENKKPFLGICLGMQLVAKSGEEHGPTDGLGWFDARVIALEVPKQFKIPHMGWNDVSWEGNNPLFQGLKTPTTFYFVHSYHFVPVKEEAVYGIAHHGMPFVATVSRDNIHLVQFHPEKSQDKGLKVLENFSDMVMAFGNR